MSLEKATLEFENDKKVFEMEELQSDNNELNQKVAKLYDQIREMNRLTSSDE
jgi:hypothetical protein